MSGRLAVLILLTSTALGSLRAPQTANRRAVLKKFGQCRGLAALPVLFHDVAIAPSKTTGEKTLSFRVTVREEITQRFSITNNLWRCDSSGNPDSCELILKDLNVTNVCDIMGRKGELWSDFMAHLNMPQRCPVKPGTYTMTRCPINTDFLKFLPISNAVYKVKSTGWDGAKKVACVELEEEVLASYKVKGT